MPVIIISRLPKQEQEQIPILLKIRIIDQFMKDIHVFWIMSVAVFTFNCSEPDEKIDPDDPDNNPEEQQMNQTFHVQMGASGQVLWNVADNVNVWNYSSWTPLEQAPADHFRNSLPFVKYVQLMTAAGGSPERDLLISPSDKTVSDDYNFTPLIRACRNLRRQGLTPHLKLGNVPWKYSSNPRTAGYGVNVCPPDDYAKWHAYIKALATSLVDEFGLAEVGTWRFGCVTEYENRAWFSVNDNPALTRDAYFKLYDYTVNALQQALGDDVCIGAHSMTCSEGLWDEREFIAHCARGTNYCTGQKGTRVCFLSSSFYEESPGKPVTGDHTFPESISILRNKAETEGLNDLFYGVDEGRILNGLDGKPLEPRAVGYTWQAAFDARLYRMAYDHQVDYFSHWNYTTGDVVPGGIPSVSAQTSGFFSRLAGAIRLTVQPEMDEPFEENGETAAVAAWNREQNRVYLLFYAYSNSIQGKGSLNIACRLDGIEKSGNVAATRTLISDHSNFFDDWLADWGKYGISKGDFGSWSADGFVINSSLLPAERVAHYRSCAALSPKAETLTVKNGTLNIETSIPVHGVLLYEIELLR
jgi:xylan 1,4-beta-xylosidase